MSQAFLVIPPSIKILQVPNPAAGAEWSYTVPDATFILVRSIKATLAATVGGVDRIATVKFTDGTNQFYQAGAGAAHRGADTKTYYWSPGHASRDISVVDWYMKELTQDLYLPPGFVFSSLTYSLIALDQWSDIFIYFSPFNFPEDRG